jgi:nicotinate-nucleotide adenylyltransferase
LPFHPSPLIVQRLLNSTAPIGVLGGTFDPIHFAHLRLAQELAAAVGLEKVRFIPAGIPPHRGVPAVSGAHRLAMVRAAIDGNPLFELDDRELRRTGPSYSYDTLKELRAESGNRPLCLLIGTDAFAALTTWHRWEALFELAHFVVAHRPGYAIQETQAALPRALRNEFITRLAPDAGALREKPAGGVLLQETTSLDISATDIRALCAAGQSPRYLLPDAVLEYIERNCLYKERNGC